MAVRDEINWLHNDEPGNEETLNRPLGDLVNIIDTYELSLINNLEGFKVDITLIDSSVDELDFVYKGTDGLFYRAKAPEFNNTIGIYKIIDGYDFIITSGIIDYENLVVGNSYFLSNLDYGKITDIEYFKATRVGIALSPSLLHININIAPSRLLRLDKYFQELDITNIIYDSNNNVESIDYVTGNKEVSTRTNDLLEKTEYFDIDGSTLLATKTYGYDNNDNLISTLWSE